MATYYRTPAFFIRKSARGEADELFTVYTENFGKLKVFGRAIRKINSKLKGGADTFYLSEIEFIQGKIQKTLTDVRLISKFPHLRRDLKKVRLLYKITGILDELVSKEEKDEGVWELLEDVLKRLNDPKFKIYSLPLMYYYFFWNLAALLGYHPDIAGCSIKSTKVDCDAVKIIKVILKKDWPILSRLKIEIKHQRLLKSVSEWYNYSILK